MPAAAAMSLMGSGAIASLIAMSDGTGESSCTGVRGRADMAGGRGMELLSCLLTKLRFENCEVVEWRSSAFLLRFNLICKPNAFHPMKR